MQKLNELSREFRLVQFSQFLTNFKLKLLLDTDLALR